MYKARNSHFSPDGSFHTTGNVEENDDQSKGQVKRHTESIDEGENGSNDKTRNSEYLRLESKGKTVVSYMYTPSGIGMLVEERQL